MQKSVISPANQGRWTSLWVVALLSLMAQLWLCQFFSFGERVPVSLDINPSNLWKFVYHFPPTGSFQVLNWLGVAYLPQSLNPFSLAARVTPWLFFTAYAPVLATLSLLTMAAFLRELELPRPAALFSAVIYAWQGDLLPFVFPAHFAYITTWPFFAIAAWGALRAQRTRHWAYAVMSGASCGLMVQLQPDRGGIASLLIAALYAAPTLNRLLEGKAILGYLTDIRHLALCAGVALLISVAAILALFQTNIVGIKLGGQADREANFKYVTQFSLAPAETLTYLVPGFYGWHISNREGPYWGWIGEWPDWPKNHQGQRNLNLAISTTGTVATVLALIGVVLLLPGRLLGQGNLADRQRFYGRALLTLGFIALVLSWGWHTPFYRPLTALPLMDKWRNPLKWLEMTNFALVTLSAFGVQHLLASLNEAAPGTKVVRQRLSWFCGAIFVILGLGLLATYPYAIVLASALKTEGYEAYGVANIMSTLHVSLLVALILMGLFCFLLHGLWRPERLRETTLENPWLNRIWREMLTPEYLPLTLALGFIGLSVAQLGWVTTHFIQPTNLAEITESNPLLEELKSENPPAGPAIRVSVATEDPVLNVLLLNQFNTANLACLDISAASRIPDDLNAFLGTLNDDKRRLWLLTGVKNVVVPQQYIAQMRSDPVISANVDHADGYTLEPTGSPKLPSHALVAMRDYLEKATMVPHAEIIPKDDAMLKRLKDPAWNPRESILLSSPATGVAVPSADKAKDASEPSHVELKSYTPTEILMEVASPKGGYVLVNDQYDPDWQALVNGKDAPILRADYIMRAVQVPPGRVTVEMRYAARYRIGDILRAMSHGHLDIGNCSLSADAVNNFSDAAMIAAWLIAGFALWTRKVS